MKKLDELFQVKYQTNLGLSGMTDESFCLYLKQLLNQEKKSILLVTSSLTEANIYLNNLTTLTDDVLFFPMDDFLTSEALSITPDLKVTRLETLNELLSEKPKIVITNLMGYLRYLPSKKVYQDNIINLKTGMEIEPKELVNKLYDIGYKRETIVTTTGEIGVRGFIIDIFPVSFNHPIRIEFFGDEIDSIREFDEDKYGEVEFKNVSFKYPDAEDNVISNINFVAKPGQTTAFIGSTGSGKSFTVANVSEYVDINSNLFRCNKGATNKLSDMTGDFPLLEVGDNEIVLGTNVTKVIITPNFRYL